MVLARIEVCHTGQTGQVESETEVFAGQVEVEVEVKVEVECCAEMMAVKARWASEEVSAALTPTAWAARRRREAR